MLDVQGNVVLWKPSDTAVLSSYIVFKLLREAGVPPGVINFLPADGPVFGDTVTASPDLAGVNFVGSSVNNTVVAVTDDGKGCGHPNVPSINARVSGFADWIHDTICQHSAKPPKTCTKQQRNKGKATIAKRRGIRRDIVSGL